MTYPMTVWTLGPKLMYIVCLVPAALSGVVLTLSKLFTALPLLALVGQVSLGNVYFAIHLAAEGKAGINRFLVRLH